VGSVVSPALFGQLEFGHLARASSLCGACREACPVDIDLPKLLLKIRAGTEVNQTKIVNTPNSPAPLAFGLKLFTFAGSSPWRFAAAQWLAGVIGSVARLIAGGDPWIHLPMLSGWGYSKDFPAPTTRTFRSRYRRHAQPQLMGNRLNELPDENPKVHQLKIESVLPNEINGTENFASEVEALGASFTYCSSDQVAGRVLDILHGRDIDALLAWETAYLPEGLLEQLVKAGIQINHPNVMTLDSDSQVQAGLTGASAGIADTGSLLLLGGKGRPLTSSLLPHIHIALLREEDIYVNLEQALERIDIRQAPVAVLITGPSRTADIEMTLTIGVHGPGELHVICLRKE
jgi:L-lactate dehydrogenase complex protein LldG